MKILFTGTSSFTGYWFVKQLNDAGHQVYAIFRNSGVEDYEGVRKKRVDEISRFCNAVWDCSFGDNKFLELINSESNWDLLCHHAADVANYKSEAFNFSSALKNNTYNIQSVFENLQKKNCNSILLTGSVFEQGEGAGDYPLRAFSPYGLSKSFTYQTFNYFARQYGLKLGKFVIPNPFGPLEEFRFTSFLINSWKKGDKPTVKTPAYVRDNIHIDLLAKSYRKFAESLLENNQLHQKINPSGYVESQGAFAKRFAEEIKKRSDLACELDLAVQKEFSEPKVRINIDLAENYVENWNEKETWDKLVKYYLTEMETK